MNPVLQLATLAVLRPSGRVLPAVYRAPPTQRLYIVKLDKRMSCCWVHRLVFHVSGPLHCGRVSVPCAMQPGQGDGGSEHCDARRRSHAWRYRKSERNPIATSQKPSSENGRLPTARQNTAKNANVSIRRSSLALEMAASRLPPCHSDVAKKQQVVRFSRKRLNRGKP